MSAAVTAGIGGVGKSGPDCAAGFSGAAEVVTGMEAACAAEVGCAYAGAFTAAFATTGFTGTAAGAFGTIGAGAP